MRRLTAVIGILTAFGASACSGDDRPAPKPAATASPTRPPTPAAALPSVTLPDRPAELVEVLGKQVRAAGTVHAELRSTGGQGDQKIDERINAQLRTNVTPPQAQLTIVDTDPEQPGTTEAVISGGTVYTRVDGAEQAPGKPWVRLARQDAANPEVGPLGKVLAGTLNEVDKALGELAADTGLAIVRGGAFKGAPKNETVEGVAVHRYQGGTRTADLAGRDKSFEAMSKLGLKEVAWTLWVDDKGLPRKFEADLATPQKMRVRQTVSYRRWGEPVIITVPPADKVHVMGS
ncbi:hypothetical protein ACFVH6_17650 [Spirillospora sp. NPDC127200]